MDVEEPLTEIEESDCDNINDPGSWPSTIPHQFRTTIVKNGPIQLKLQTYPRNAINRCFSDTYYIRKLTNGETQPRRWLIYSISTNSLFCFPCKLFRNSGNDFCETGFADWVNSSDRLKMHERSVIHLEAMSTWLEMEKNLKLDNTIDKKQQILMETESQRMKMILERIVAVIVFLAENNLSFRGSNDMLFKPRNGNFLGIIQLIAKFDPILKEYLARISTSKKRRNTYLSHKIQNELISSMANEVRKTIIASVGRAKYYSILLDCTPDISHKEQLSVILRFIDTTDNIVSIRENFICFVVIEDTTGSGLSEKIKEILISEGLSLSDCRGQGYDNGANMKG